MKPIIMSTEDVRAVLDGRKTMTRRVIKPQPDCPYVGFDNWCDSLKNAERLGKIRKMPYVPGDILWVRETWFRQDCTPDCAGQEDENECPFNLVGDMCYGYKTQYLRNVANEIKWRPSIHMPKEAARIFLRVKDVRVERVQEILCNDMLAEGVIPSGVKGGQWQQWQREYFAPLWDSINAKRGHSWGSNPWVWVYTFERITKEEAADE